MRRGVHIVSYPPPWCSSYPEPAPTAKTVATAKPSASATPTVTGSVKNPAQGGVALPTAGRGNNEGEDDHGRGEHGDGQREEHEDDD